MINHARARGLSGHKPKYFVPEECLEPLLSAKKAFEAMGGGAEVIFVPFLKGFVSIDYL